MEDLREYQIRIWGLDRRLLYVSPTIHLSEQDATQKAAELLSVHGGASFTVEPQPRNLNSRR